MGNENMKSQKQDSVTIKVNQKNNKKSEIKSKSQKRISSQQSSVYLSKKHMKIYGVTSGAPDLWRQRAQARVPKKNQLNKIKEIFKTKKKLGEGATGSVSKVVNKITQEKSALKQLKNKYFAEHQASIFLRELIILESLEHPNILQLKDVYMDKNGFYIETAYYNGGELFDKIAKAKKFTEKQAIKYLVPLLNGVSYIHKSGFVHRDLKPSNIVFDENGVLKIIDFGTAEIVIDDEIYEYNKNEPIGTELFCSPEWERDRNGIDLKKSDTWAIGIITYVMMCGCFPFRDTLDILQFKNVLKLPPKFIKQKLLSKECLSFLHGTIEARVKKRLTADQCLKHPWITGMDKKKESDMNDIGLHVMSSIRKYNNDTKINRIITKQNLNELDDDDNNLLMNNIKDVNDVKNFLMSKTNTVRDYDDNNIETLETNHDIDSKIDEDLEIDEFNNNRAQYIYDALQEFWNKGTNGDEIELEYSQKMIDDDNDNGLTKGNDEEEFAFDSEIVQMLMSKGLGTQQECIQACMKTKSNDINILADWLLSEDNAEERNMAKSGDIL